MSETAADLLIETLWDWGGLPGDGVVDPFEPPMPAKITVDQAAKLAASLARGQPDRTKIALTILRDKVRELV